MMVRFIEQHGFALFILLGLPDRCRAGRLHGLICALVQVYCSAFYILGDIDLRRL